MFTIRQSEIASIVASLWADQMWMIMALYVNLAIWKNTMARGTFFMIDAEHDGDIQHYKSLIIDNGGEVEEVVWTGVEDDDAYIVFSAPTKEQVDNIKSILKDG